MLSTIDVALTQWFNGPAGHHPLIDGLMIATTKFMVPLMIVAVAVRWWAGTDRRNERMLAVEAGLTFLLGLLVNQLILLFVNRMRPYDAGVTHLIIAPSADPSFPSDHATAATAIVMAILLNHREWRALLMAVPAILLMLSRVYVGTHYVSDVVGGVGTGLLAAFIIHATASLRAPITAAIIRFL